MKTPINPSSFLRRSIGAFLAGLSTILLIPGIAFGYGNEGHRTVGAIADKLIQGTNAEQHVKELLGNESLEIAALWADEVKGDSLTSEMKAYVKNNPRHKSYHFTDIPIQESAYRDNSEGARPEDVVHMIRRCILILEGKDKPSTNPTGITKKEALRLLAHFVGDIHQPLHVGAAFFDAADQLANPNTVKGMSETQGGNFIQYRGKLHSYWDTQTVKNAMRNANAATPRRYASILAQTPPSGVSSGMFISQWSRSWADEMIPLARQAHEKLTFGPRHTVTEFGKKHPVWPARANDGNNAYDRFASEVTARNLALGGHRLAALLKKIWP